MKITCQSCQAKYTIADDKVLGKIVKIRCKKCNETIVVNGSDPAGAAGFESSPPAYDASGGDDTWTVNVADGDQRTMTGAEIAAAYQAGAIGDETYCWKDGMGDWLPLREIDPLVEACNATRAVISVPPPPRGPSAAPAYASGGENGSASAAAARRAGGRAPGGDLFGGAARAGSEEDMMTSAPAHLPEPRDDGQRPTGARNENSVLFSLSALTSKGQSERPPMPGSEQSGLIDIRQLSAQMGQMAAEKKQSRVDDIMNLTSGAVYSQALAAPVLSAPALAQYGGAPEGGTGSAMLLPKSRALVGAVVAGVFIVAAGIGATIMLVHGKAPDGTAKAGHGATAASALAARASAPAAVAPAPAAPSAVAAVAPAASAAAVEPQAEVAKKDEAEKPAEERERAEEPAHRSHAAAPHPAAEPVKAAPAPAPEVDAPFNMGEAKSRLAAAAAATEGCKKAGGPTGTGRVVVLFAPRGNVQSATVSGPPFEGTPTGACVAAKFRGVHVPAFSGSPFSVSKHFTIN